LIFSLILQRSEIKKVFFTYKRFVLIKQENESEVAKK
jgi:hypothetical protein